MISDWLTALNASGIGYRDDSDVCDTSRGVMGLAVSLFHFDGLAGERPKRFDAQRGPERGSATTRTCRLRGGRFLVRGDAERHCVLQI